MSPVASPAALARPPAAAPPRPSAPPAFPSAPPIASLRPEALPMPAVAPPISADLRMSLPDRKPPRPPAAAPAAICTPRLAPPVAMAAAIGSATPAMSPTMPRPFGPWFSATRLYWPVAGSRTSTPQYAFLGLSIVSWLACWNTLRRPSSPAPAYTTLPSVPPLTRRYVAFWSTGTKPGIGAIYFAFGSYVAGSAGFGEPTSP